MIDLCLDALTPGYARVYSILAAMAEAGEPCPGNVELARLTGYQTHGGAVHAVTCLKRAGLIEVYRGQNRRIVRIISTGKETKGEMPAPGIFRRAAPCFEQKLPPRVRRDPCPRCGVRGDLGCRHAPAGWGA